MFFIEIIQYDLNEIFNSLLKLLSSFMNSLFIFFSPIKIKLRLMKEIQTS